MNVHSEADERLQQLIYRLSHDLRAPLRGIVGVSGLLHKRYGEQLDEKARRWLDLLVKDSQKANQQVEALLTYSRLLTHMGEPAPIDLSRVCDRLREQRRDQINATAAIVTHVDLPVVSGATLHFETLLGSLLDNALSYQSREAGHIPEINLCAVQRAGDWVLTCDDNGLGIPADEYSTVTGIFYRLPRDIEAGEGARLGMGLAYCQRIAEVLDGNLVLSPSPKGGLRVAVTLPSTMLA